MVLRLGLASKTDSLDSSCQSRIILSVFLCVLLSTRYCCPADLTTYDSAKQAILRNTSLKDTAITHALAR